MGQYERRNFADDGVLELYYEKFYAHKKRIELALENNQYDPYGMRGLIRAAKLISSHPDDRNGNPKVLSTVELVNDYQKIAKSIPNVYSVSYPQLFDSQQSIFDSYAEIIMGRHRKDSTIYVGN